MRVTINGESTELNQIEQLQQLIDHLQLGHKRIALELNEQIIPRSRFAEQGIKDGDRIEIIHAIGGG